MDNDAAIQPDAPQSDFNIQLGSVADPMNDTPLVTTKASNDFPTQDDLDEEAAGTIAVNSQNKFGVNLSDDPDELFIEAMRDIDYNADNSYRLLKRVVELQPNNGRAYTFLGWIWNKYLKNTAKAIEFYRKALELEKAFGLTYVYLSEALMKVNKYDEAFQIITSAGDVDDIDLYSYHMILGEISEYNEKYEEAIVHYKQALKYSFSNQSANSIKLSIERAMQKQSDHLFHLQNF